MMMKRLTTLLFTMCITLLGFGRGAVTPAQSLIKRLIKIQKRGVMIGHQDDPVYGRTWKWERNRSDVRDLVFRPRLDRTPVRRQSRQGSVQ